MKLNERLLAARKSAKHTQYSIAEALDVDRGRYCNWELGRAMPPVEMLSRICDVLNVSADYLLGRTDDPRGYKIEKPAELADLGVESVVKSGSNQLTPEEVAAIRSMLQREGKVNGD